jgi:hypothetical protein
MKLKYGLRQRKCKGQPTTGSVHFKRKLLYIETNKLFLLRGKFDEDDGEYELLQVPSIVKGNNFLQ